MRSYQFYVPAALFPEKEAHIPISPVRLGTVPVYTHMRREKLFCSCLVSKLPRSFIHSDYGFGGLVVSMLASGTQVYGFKPGLSCWIFTGVKILCMPSSGGEVKKSVPCPSFTACQRT